MCFLTSCGRIGIFTLILFCLPQRVYATGATIPVSTAAELHQALKDAQPGQTIALADGIYRGEFTITQNGTQQQPITLQGSPAAILEGESASGGYALHIDGATYWTLTGFTLRNAAKGIMLDKADNNTLDNLQIYQIGQEAVHFRTCSSDNRLQYSTIYDTGVVTPSFGEGVYIGSDADQWSQYSCDADLRDKSHRNQILHNHFGPNVRAEAIDVKEGTVGGAILDNEFDATGLSGANFADSWVDIKGNHYHVARNHGYPGNNPQLKHGFETHGKQGGWGRNNIFYDNVIDLNSNGYGFHLDRADQNHGNLVCTNNTVNGAGGGVANIPLTGPLRTAQSANQATTQEQTEAAAHRVAATTTLWLPLVIRFPC